MNINEVLVSLEKMYKRNFIYLIKNKNCKGIQCNRCPLHYSKFCLMKYRSPKYDIVLELERLYIEKYSEEDLMEELL